ncbi:MULTISPECIES: VOC family protein [unclassified Aureimonas]|uniref:VOC family protein n=1 Tax=unclassified Aureimonas TaxID=2615206 RepID=UPI0006F402D2|nr:MULTISPECIES: VOC family protein [unclassified Aureimonas]KQT52284.1 glyoxalase [Aureimonas sp. Leaf427]KQT61830.1 glyoxalase [Aureimonas sp. Leaf460]
MTTATHTRRIASIDPVLTAAPHRIAKVTLVVRDLDRVADFYRKVIGLEDTGRTVKTMGLGVNGKTLLELRHEPSAKLRSPREAGLFHIAFLLPERADLGAWVNFVAKQSIAVQGAADHLVSEALYLADPEGNGTEIYVDRPSSQWTWDGDTIRMSSNPIDMEDLMRSAAGRAWSGFSDGGIVGHVHLQVGDLARAEGFYGDLLGFDLTNRYPGAYFFGTGGYHHQLAANIWNSRGALPRTDLSTGLSHVEIETARDVLEATRGRLADRMEIDEPSRLTVRDPWNTAITLTAR